MKKKDFEKAVQYVRKNKTWSMAEEMFTAEFIDRNRCSLYCANIHIADEICDLMEEYGDEHDLPEGWWMEFGTEDDIFFLL